MDAQPEFFKEFPQSPDPNRDFVRSGRKIIPVSFWKDGRIRADLSRYGKGVLVSRNRLNLSKRIREIFANALAEADECVTEAERLAERAALTRGRRLPQIGSAPAPE